MIIKLDDLKVGNVVTVLNWLSHKDNSYKGDLLKIIAINIPFISVKEILHHDSWKQGLVLDTRCVELSLLSDDFVKKTISAQKNKEKSENPTTEQMDAIDKA